MLIPDFQGKSELIHKVIEAAPEVISHNMETVERLTPQIRSAAKYRTSLEVIRIIATSGIVAKSGIMLGLGETEAEVLQVMDDLREVGCKVMTIGQFLAPTPRSHSGERIYYSGTISKSTEQSGLKRVSLLLKAVRW